MKKKKESTRGALLQRIKKDLYPEIPRGFVGVGEGDDCKEKSLKSKEHGKAKK